LRQGKFMPSNQMLFPYLATKNAKYHPHKIFLKAEARQITFEEFDKRTNSLAQNLRSRGIRKGDRVAAVNHNSIELLEIYFGAMKIGAIPVPINIFLEPQELEKIAADIEPGMIFVGTPYHKKIEALRDHRTWKEIVWIGENPSEGYIPYEKMIAGNPPDPVEFLGDDDDVAIIILTSGTTGTPKGVMLTHRNLLSDAWASVISRRLVPDDIALVTAPIYQAGALGSMIANIYRGNTIILMNGFNPDRVLSTIQREKVTTVLFVPTMIIKLLQVSNLQQYDLKSLKTVIYGSAPMPVGILKEAMSRFQWEFLGACGATETGPAYIAVLSYEDHHLDGSPDMEKRLYSIGKEGINSEVRIFSEKDQDLPPNEVGEIVVRGPNIMKGYWRKPEETAEALRQGWYHTGDLGYMDKDGYIYIVDRKKDLIISGGFNVYPKEIENVLNRHPAVLESAVVGVPHELWGETPLAFIILKPGSPRPEAANLMEFLKGKIAGYKLPKGGFVFVDSLPRNPSGKILKRELRRQYGNIPLRNLPEEGDR